MILQSEIYNFHRLDLTRQAGFVVTIYDEDGLRLAATEPFVTDRENNAVFSGPSALSGHFVAQSPRPLYPQKRTCAVQTAMSALGQKRT